MTSHYHIRADDNDNDNGYTRDSQGRLLLAGYIPTLWATLVALVLFCIVAVTFWTRYFRGGRERWMLCLCIGTTTMAIGYIARIPLTYMPDELGAFITQQIIIFLSPCAFLAHVYIILPRLATWLNAEDALFLPSRKVVRIFVWSDVVTFLTQANGASLVTGKSHIVQRIGYWLTFAGIIAQLLSFILFCVLAITFGLKLRSRYPQIWNSSRANLSGVSRLSHWQTMYWALLWSCLGLMVRTIFRTVEYAQGVHGYLSQHEIYFYLLDNLPIFLTLLVWAFVWPPRVLTEDDKPEDGQIGMGRLESATKAARTTPDIREVV